MNECPTVGISQFKGNPKYYFGMLGDSDVLTLLKNNQPMAILVGPIRAKELGKTPNISTEAITTHGLVSKGFFNEILSRLKEERLLVEITYHGEIIGAIVSNLIPSI